MLAELVRALSRNEIEAAVAASPRLQAMFPRDIFDTIYIPWERVPDALKATFLAHGQMTDIPLFWRGATENGTFTLESADRAYTARGAVRFGRVAGLLTIDLGEVVYQAMMVDGRPHGPWTAVHEQSASLLATVPYVDGRRQGTAVYHYDPRQELPDAGGGPKVFEIDYVNDEPTTWREYAAGRVAARGRFSAEAMV